MLTARHAMTSAVVSVRADASLDEAIDLLLKHHVSGLPVVDEDDRLVGVLSEFDLLRLIYDLDARPETVADCMSTDVLTVDEDDSLIGVTELLLNRRFRRVPVVRDGKLVGVLGRRDLIRVIRNARNSLVGMSGF